MAETVPVAVPRKGRPLEAVLERLADVADDPSVGDVADSITSTLRFEKAVTKGQQHPDRDAYCRLADYSSLSEPTRPEYTLVRDDREAKPRRVVFDSVTLPMDGVDLQLVGREEPFRALRTHDFALGFDSADLVLEEVVSLAPAGVETMSDVNARIDPRESDVRVVSGLGDTVHHTLLARPASIPAGVSLDREFVADYEGELCLSPRYERLVEAVLGTDAIDGVEFVYPGEGVEEEAAIADTGVGVYLTVTGSTARDHGLVIGEDLFPSETVLMENAEEVGSGAERVKTLVEEADLGTELRPA
ncbi:MAG: hypothetical protein ABEJ79_09365 [Halolamina sp.]